MWLEGFNLGWQWGTKKTGYKQMKLTIVRVDVNDYGIFGHLSCDGDSFNCLTLENNELNIPEGTYKVTLYLSPKFGLVPLLHDVPGRSYIEIHKGNTEADSTGCILVGMSRKGTTLCESKSAFDSLMKVLEGCDDISLKIR